MKKINKFFKKYFLLFTIISLVLTILGLIFKHFDNLIIISNICFIIASVFSGIPILFRAISSLRHKVISIELLVSIAVIGAFCIQEYSECALVTFLFQFGMFLEQKTMQKTRSAIKDLVKLAPEKANRINNEIIEVIDANEVEKDDLLLIKEGEKVPVDGIVIQGEGYLMEATITGESLPQHKNENDFLYAGTILESGQIKMKATRVGEETTFNKIISLVEEASDAKSPLDRFIDRFAKYYTPIVILISILTLIILRFVKGYFDIDTAITVLVLACPGALVIGAPIASVSGIGRGAKDYILLKGGDAIHQFSKSDVFVFDKTGTLTKGEAKILSTKYYGNDENDLREVISLESLSNHPLSKAIINEGKNISLINNLQIKTIKGQGISGNVNNNSYLIGNEKLLKDIEFNQEQKDYIEEIKSHASSLVLVSKNNKLIYIFEIGDEIKEDAQLMISLLKKKGVKRFIMLTGDNYKTSEYVAKKIGINEFYSDLLPEDKLSIVKKLIDEGNNITFVGDGINDAPALALANTSISMGSGTDIAIETSSVVLINSSLLSLVKAYSLSKKTVLISYENVIISILTVILLLIGLFMNYIHMGLGMLIHEGSIFIVILNAMRLLIWRIK